ncbi:MAG: heavy-metal-associated domain-containing protein, partial [Acidimicrobiia bacterium]|nr:heavy-metal-associated domain-containing protein [Acidimicrobiia bacterium]
MTTETTTARNTPALEHVELPIEGMTCASCARRIEKRLNKVDGVTASVNYATEQAVVDFDPAVIDTEGLAAVVAETGYRAVLPRPVPTGDEPDVPGA